MTQTAAQRRKAAQKKTADKADQKPGEVENSQQAQVQPENQQDGDPRDEDAAKDDAGPGNNAGDRDDSGADDSEQPGLDAEQHDRLKNEERAKGTAQDTPPNQDLDDSVDDGDAEEDEDRFKWDDRTPFSESDTAKDAPDVIYVVRDSVTGEYIVGTDENEIGSESTKTSEDPADALASGTYAEAVVVAQHVRGVQRVLVIESSKHSDVYSVQPADI